MTKLPKVGGPSPWGPIQTINRVEDGILSVSTAGHGGLWLSPERLAAMPAHLKRPTTFYKRGSPWFEEDVEILRVQVAFPDICLAYNATEAERVLRNYHPEIFK